MNTGSVHRSNSCQINYDMPAFYNQRWALDSLFVNRETGNRAVGSAGGGSQDFPARAKKTWHMSSQGIANADTSARKNTISVRNLRQPFINTWNQWHVLWFVLQKQAWHHLKTICKADNGRCFPSTVIQCCNDGFATQRLKMKYKSEAAAF